MLLTGAAEAVDEPDAGEADVTDAVGSADHLPRAHVEALHHLTLAVAVLAL